METIYLGKLQHEIYAFIKKRQKVTIREVVSFLQNSRNYNTVMTVMTRMVENGHLRREKCGRKYLYFINEDKQNKVSSLLDSIKKSVFGDSTVSFVSYLLQDNKTLSKSQLKEISSLINDMKEEDK